MDAVNWILANWSTLITGVLAVLGGFSILAKLTPSDWDDKLIAKIINVIGLTKKNG